MTIQLTNRNGNGNNGNNKGVLRAIAFLPNGIRDLFGTSDMADLVSAGVPTDDDEGMLFHVDENVTMEIRPFARQLVFNDLGHVDNTTTLSYAGGFNSDDVDRVVGWYTLAKRGGSERSQQWAFTLGSKLEAPAAVTS